MKQDIEQTEFIKNYQIIDNTYYRYVSDDFQFDYGAINVVPRFYPDRKIKEEFIQFKAVVAKVNSQIESPLFEEETIIEWERCE